MRGTFHANMLNVRLLHNDFQPPEVFHFRAITRQFTVTGADPPKSTANGAYNPFTERSLMGPRDPPSTLHIQVQDFPEISDFLTKPLDVNLFESYRKQALGHNHNALDF